ncbi:het domain-containing protein [Colletotrichum sojae]|uniref:Het domain-containing protein n=1 Tax=Colletotrichum sojae TaxID=2175907 RepID=A0A8H6N375_9PEZI|nr:het domain-containing protein [Colletotrichum sojae]
MRLLDTDTLEIVSFHDFPPKPYVILSHTWGDDEVSFQEMMAVNAGKKQGFKKIWETCIKAKEDGCAYAWIDTCCIDKQSSSELSESINSMYRWYQESSICYAYLVDVPTAAGVVDYWDEDCFYRERLFKSSRWFTRGWTLQEPLAPEVVEFYASDWTEIGTKSSLTAHLARITKIDQAVLGGTRPISSCCAAEKLSWAASRETTRKEDDAYSLLGIMDVHLPLIHGEGSEAFLRLQRAMIMECEDYSLLLPGLAFHITSRLKAGGKLGDIDWDPWEDTQRGSPLADEPDAFFVEYPDVWSYAELESYSGQDSYAQLHNNSGQYSGFDIAHHHAPYFTPRGLEICLSHVDTLGAGGPGETARYETHCKTRGHRIIIRLFLDVVLRGGYLCRFRRGYDLLPYKYDDDLDTKFTSICILNLPRLETKATASPQYTAVDTTNLSSVLNIEWAPEYPQMKWLSRSNRLVLAVGWCTRAPGETGPFALVIGDHWAVVVPGSELVRRYSFLTPRMSSGSRPSWKDLSMLWDFIEVPDRGPDRILIRLREISILATFRKTGGWEGDHTLKLTVLTGKPDN